MDIFLEKNKIKNIVYQFLHGRVGLATDVIHSPHLGIDGTKAERKTKSHQPEPYLRRKGGKGEVIA